MIFQSTILTLPGLGSSGPQHWQSIWERKFGFTRIEQQDWNTPNREDWVETINNTVKQYDPANVILVAHSLACTAVAYWAQKYNTPIKAALLVAPSDTEANTFPPGTTGFTRIPLFNLPFKSIVVASTNDFYLTAERAKLFANSWGSEYINTGDAGHINVASGHGDWEEGLEILRGLDR